MRAFVKSACLELITNESRCLRTSARSAGARRRTQNVREESREVGHRVDKVDSVGSLCKANLDWNISRLYLLLLSRRRGGGRESLFKGVVTRDPRSDAHQDAMARVVTHDAQRSCIFSNGSF
jgi:hypothetical protein